MRSPTTYLIHSGRWQILLASSTWTSTKSRTHGLDGKNSTPLIMPLKASQRDIQFFCMGDTNWITKHHGAEGDSFPRSPLPAQVATHTAHGALRRGRMREPSLTTSVTIHYHLGLVCTLCMDFFAMSVQIPWGTMFLSCKAMATGNRDQGRGGGIQWWQQWWGWWVPPLGSLNPETVIPAPSINLCTLCQWQWQWCEHPKPLNSTIIQYTHTFSFYHLLCLPLTAVTAPTFVVR